MGGKSSPPPPPDYSGVAAASKESAELSFKLGQEQLAWAKEQYGLDKEVTDKVVGSFLNTQDANQESAASDRARYEQLYQPLEGELIADARSFASPERKAMEIGAAQGAVAQKFSQARQAALQNLESFGVDPTSTRYAALDIGARVQQGAAEAAAGTQAGRYVDATGRALRSEALNIGKGYPGQIATQYGTALQAGASGVNSTLAQTASGAQTMGTGVQWQGMGNQALAGWGNTLNMGYQNQLAAYKAENEQSSGWGSALGLGASLLTAPLKGTAMGAFFEEGGAVPEGATPGGAIPMEASPSGGQAVDDVSARLTAGEFVVPKDVASWKGEEFFQKLIENSRKMKMGATAKPEVKKAAPAAPTFESRPSALPVG